MSEGATVYILRWADGSLHVGITRRTVEERLSEHAQGISKGYTESRRPVELLDSEHRERADEAVAAERRLKGRSRAKEVADMRGDCEALHAFAERRGRVVRPLEPSSPHPELGEGRHGPFWPGSGGGTPKILHPRSDGAGPAIVTR